MCRDANPPITSYVSSEIHGQPKPLALRERIVWIEEGWKSVAGFDSETRDLCWAVK